MQPVNQAVFSWNIITPKQIVSTDFQIFKLEKYVLSAFGYQTSP